MESDRAPGSVTASFRAQSIKRKKEKRPCEHNVCALIGTWRKVLNFVCASLGMSSCCHFNSIIIIDCIFIAMFVLDIY